MYFVSPLVDGIGRYHVLSQIRVKNFVGSHEGFWFKMVSRAMWEFVGIRQYTVTSRQTNTNVHTVREYTKCTIFTVHSRRTDRTLLNRLTPIRFWREPKNSRKTQKSPPWLASAASSGADSTLNPDPTQTECGRVVGGGGISKRFNRIDKLVEK